jgi:hypothetical protein
MADEVLQENTLSRCEELLAKARSGEKLETDARRDVIQYLMAVEPHLSNADMARMFGLSEGMIRKDKDIVRKKASEDISKEDVGLVIGDIRRTYERFISDIQKVLSDNKLCPKGTKTYLDYQKALVDYQLKIVEALQSLGFYPKNLGTMQQNKFVFKSHVAKDGSIETKAFDPDKTPKVIEGHTPLLLAAPDEEDEKLRSALREEFSDTPFDPRVTQAEQYEEDGS